MKLKMKSNEKESEAFCSLIRRTLGCLRLKSALKRLKSDVEKKSKRVKQYECT
jgi:hypothetical protein